MDKFKEFFKQNFLAFSILLAAAIIGGALVYTKGSGGMARVGLPIMGQAPNTKDEEPIRAPDLGDLLVLGNPDAKVSIVEFGDYQCPFCGRFALETQPKIIEEYVNTGKAKFAWRDLAFLGEESVWAAEAARCANDQGKFWEYQETLFKKQNSENKGAFSKDNLKKFAKDLGLREANFANCLDSGKYRAKVQEETQKSAALGVNSTPTTFVNSRVFQGALPYATFKAAIEEELLIKK